MAGTRVRPLVGPSTRLVPAISSMKLYALLSGITGPSPVMRGRGHIFSKRLAFPLRILTLSESEIETFPIHLTAGGFITNGQSTANRM
jgi:hypothetical protein